MGVVRAPPSTAVVALVEYLSASIGAQAARRLASYCRHSELVTLSVLAAHLRGIARAAPPLPARVALAYTPVPTRLPLSTDLAAL